MSLIICILRPLSMTVTKKYNNKATNRIKGESESLLLRVHHCIPSGPSGPLLAECKESLNRNQLQS